MKKQIKKKTSYSLPEEITSVLSEAAVQYNTLRVILGGNKAVPPLLPTSGAHCLCGQIAHLHSCLWKQDSL